jgi:hypothetical protein
MRVSILTRSEPEPQMDEQLPMRQLLEPNTSASVGSDANLPTASQLHSGPTTATRLDPQHVKLDDTKSAITHSSRISTAVGPKGEAALWPDPPSYVTTDKFFVFQYCMTICSERYLGRPVEVSLTECWESGLVDNGLQNPSYPTTSNRINVHIKTVLNQTGSMAVDRSGSITKA